MSDIRDSIVSWMEFFSTKDAVGTMTCLLRPLPLLRSTARTSATTVARAVPRVRQYLSFSTLPSYSSEHGDNVALPLWNPTEEHAALRDTLRTFVQREVRRHY
jgi:hypothetical protein